MEKQRARDMELVLTVCRTEIERAARDGSDDLYKWVRLLNEAMMNPHYIDYTDTREPIGYKP